MHIKYHRIDGTGLYLVCVHVWCMPTNSRTFTYVSVHVCTYVYIIYVYLYICMYVCMRVCVCVSACVQACMYVCKMYVYACMCYEIVGFTRRSGVSATFA